MSRTMPSAVNAFFKRFIQETRANVAMTFALMFGVIAVAAGGGLDYSRSVGIGTEYRVRVSVGHHSQRDRPRRGP